MKLSVNILSFSYIDKSESVILFLQYWRKCNPSWNGAKEVKFENCRFGRGFRWN